jgi:hypothetical protein
VGLMLGTRVADEESNVMIDRNWICPRGLVMRLCPMMTSLASPFT